MRMSAVAGFVAVMLALPALAQDTPKPPTPTKEHEWLKQLDGEWDTDGEMYMEPGKPPVKCKGTMTFRNLGGFWSIAEMKGDFMGIPVTGMMTIGYDAEKKQYTGTWVCSMSDCLSKYEGSREGNILTLNTEGPSPDNPKKIAKMKDVIELKDKDSQVMTSWILGDDGKWSKMMTMTSKRKK